MKQEALVLGDRVHIVVDDRIRIGLEGLDGAIVEAIKHAFTHANPARVKLERLGLSKFALSKEPPVIATWIMHADSISVPRGGMGRVRSVLTSAGRARHVTDARIDGDPALAGKIPPHKLVTGGALYDFQQQIVDEMLEVQNGFVRAPTGAGKSAAALAFASIVNLPTIVVVHNTGLLKQWIVNAREQLGLSADEVGVIGAGVFRIRPLTIAMQQTVRAPSTLARVRGVFGNLIADELQTAAAATFAATYDRFPARFRLGMSANERRRDRKEFLIYDLFGDEPIVDVDQNELIERQIVHDVEVRVVPTSFDSPWYAELKKQLRAAEIVQAKTGERVPKTLVTARMASFDQLVGEMMIDADRQALVASIVAEEVAAGEQVLVLSHRREHCARNDADVSAKGIRTGMMIGGADDRAEFDRALRGLHDGSIRVVAGTYQAIGTGIDLPSVAVGVCTTPIAGSKEGKPFYQQVRGRLCRRADGKRGARIWYLWDRRVFGLEPLRNLIRWNRTVLVRDGDGWVGAREWIEEAQR